MATGILVLLLLQLELSRGASLELPLHGLVAPLNSVQLLRQLLKRPQAVTALPAMASSFLRARQRLTQIVRALTCTTG